MNLLSLTHSGTDTAICEVADVKKRLELVDSDHDVFIAGLILEAQAEVQNALNRTLLTQTVTARYRPARAFKLFCPPFQSITSIKSFYEGVETEEDTNSFYVLHGLIPTYQMKRSAAWTASRIDEVEIEYTAGYGAAAEDVPLTIRQAIEQLAAAKFMFRFPREIGSVASGELSAGSWETTLRNSGLVVPHV